MKKKQYHFIFLIIIGFLISGCIKSSIIGDNILNKDEIGVEYTDTLTLKAKTLKNDSLRVYPSGASSFLLGQLQNRYIGNAKADMFLDFRTLGEAPDTNIFNFDSIVLTIIIDTSRFYGDRFEKIHLDIFELNETIRKNDSITYYSDQTLDYIPSKIGETEFVPLSLDSLDVIEPDNDTIKYKDRLRIRLSDELGIRFLSDFEKLKDDTLFKDMFKGLYLESTVDKNSMVGITDFNARRTSITGLEVYYTIDSTLKKLSFPLHHAISHFDHDYSGSEMQLAFDNSIAPDSFMYLQGMVGSKLEIEIPDFSFLKDKNLNKASLILYAVKENDIIQNMPYRLITYTKDSTGTATLVDDYRFSISLQDPSFYYGFGNDTEAENGIKTTKYIINLTLFLREKIKNGIFNTDLTIIPDDRMENPGFAKFYGVKNSILRSKLNIVYSNTN